MKLKQIFKEKVTRKLAIYSLSILVVFSIIVVGIFAGFFKRYIVNNEYIINNQKDFVIKNARNISKSIYIDEYNRVYINQRELESNEDFRKIYASGGYNYFGFGQMYTWIIGKNKKILITDTTYELLEDFSYQDLTEYEKSVVNSALEGEEIILNSFSYFTDEILITAGVPIRNINVNAIGYGNYKMDKYPIVGVLLVQSVVKSSQKVLVNGLVLMFWSLLIAFIFSYILFIVFSHKFTKPLYKMRDNAFELSKGNYDVKNNIFQDDEIGYLANTLDFLSLKLKEADEQTKNLEKMRSDFISNISHELRTPATVMVGSLEALVDGIVTNEEDIKEYHVNMLNEAKFLSRLIGDLLDISRLQNLDFVIEKSQLCILDVVNDVVRSLIQLASKKNISIDLYKHEFKNEIYGDYGRLKQMFSIILDNAIKFSDENSKIEITLQDNKIKIKDYGAGIKKEDLPYIFDRFYKERSEKNKVGTGLGLSIAKSIAIRHDINLSVESVLGKYTEFIFEY